MSSSISKETEGGGGWNGSFSFSDPTIGLDSMCLALFAKERRGGGGKWVSSPSDPVVVLESLLSSFVHKGAEWTMGHSCPQTLQSF